MQVLINKSRGKASKFARIAFGLWFMLRLSFGRNEKRLELCFVNTFKLFVLLAGVMKRSLRMVREVYPPDIEPDIESIQPQGKCTKLLIQERERGISKEVMPSYCNIPFEDWFWYIGEQWNKSWKNCLARIKYTLVSLKFSVYLFIRVENVIPYFFNHIRIYNPT